MSTVAWRVLGCGLLALFIVVWLRGTPGQPVGDEPAAGVQARLERDGVAIEFAVRPVDGSGVLMEGQLAEIQFRLKELASGRPLRGSTPGAWLDQVRSEGRDSVAPMSCQARIGVYLKGVMGARPSFDLNSYYLLLLNSDPSITVIDPSISVGGITSTMARIPLQRAPQDWVASGLDKRLFVSMPDAGAVAVVDTESFRVVANIEAGSEPVRIALQPDQRYLWVGNNARRADASGVTVIDTATLEVVMSATTGAGHHEIAFSGDSRHAFVSNRDAGTVTVFDVATLKKLHDIETGPQPLSVAYSVLSKAIYVSDGKAGTITVIDAATLQQRSVIEARRGIGPLRFSGDGRYGFVLNTLEDSATIIDAGSDRIRHIVEVAPEPYQLTFGRGYAYVRGLASPRVTMINLASLGSADTPLVQAFEAGQAAPKLAGNLPLATSLAPGRDNNTLFVVNPVDNTTYFYMEGMNAPMSGYPNRGHSARAAMVVDRSLTESEPGLFRSRIRLPAAGAYDVALLLNQPELTHCFALTIEPDPQLQQALASARVEFLLDRTTVPAGSEQTVRFRVVRGEGQGQTAVDDLRLRYFLAPASSFQEVPAREVGEGVYEAAVKTTVPGAYYLHVGSQSLGLRFGGQVYASLRAVAPSS